MRINLSRCRPRGLQARAQGRSLLGMFATAAMLLLAVIPSTIGSAVAAEGATPRWYPPLGPPLSVSEAFRPPPTPYAAGHRGIDLPAAPGISVHAPTSGTVSFVGKVVDRGVISIKVGAHTVLSMEPVDAEDLSEGDVVLRGEVIGAVSEGGHCEDGCLHLGVRVDSRYVNPMRYFVGRPVLLPW